MTPVIVSKVTGDITELNLICIRCWVRVGFRGFDFGLWVKLNVWKQKKKKKHSAVKLQFLWTTHTHTLYISVLQCEEHYQHTARSG